MFAFLMTVLLTLYAQGAPPAALQPLQFLLGDWQAIGSGKPEEGTGGFTFKVSLQNRVIVRTNYADYPASGGRPASRHEDLMVIYVEGEVVKADYHDSEGHIIRYTLQSPAAGEVVFVSDAAAAAPRYRLTYRLGADKTLAGRFEIAPPGKPDAFSTYLSWSARKVGQ